MPGSYRQGTETPERSWSQTVAAGTLARDDVVLVRAGALVPADGTVIDGQSHVEEAMLTETFADAYLQYHRRVRRWV